MEKKTRKEKLIEIIRERLREIDDSLMSNPPNESLEAYERRSKEAIQIREMLKILNEEDDES